MARLRDSIGELWGRGAIRVLLGVAIGAVLTVLAYPFLARGPGHGAPPAAPPPSGDAALAGNTPSIAVLPFANMTEDRQLEYFSDGISEEILNALSRVNGLRVTARASSFAMKGRDEDPRTIGQRLNVGTLLEGSVRKSGSRVRIAAELVETGGGSRLWAQEFERETEDVFKVQDEIAQAVVAALQLKLLTPVALQAANVDPGAHDLYLHGLAQLARGSAEGSERAVQALQAAVDRDPGFARAWAALATARFRAADQGTTDPAMEWPKALEAAERAVSIAPTDADGWLARGFVKVSAYQDWEGARADLEKARTLNPNSAETHYQYGRLLAALGRLGEAGLSVQLALARDPFSANTHVMEAMIHLGEGRYDLARVSAERALDLAPEHARAARTLGFALLLQSKLPEAREAFHRSGARQFEKMGDALVESSLGHEAASRKVLDQILADPDTRKHACYQTAQIFAWRGESDRAFEWLDRAAETHDTGLIYLKYDPVLVKLRSDPRYNALLTRLKLPVG